jgi:hypothetical protein
LLTFAISQLKTKVCAFSRPLLTSPEGGRTSSLPSRKIRDGRDGANKAQRACFGCELKFLLIQERGIIKERFFNAFRFYNKHFDREHQLWHEESHPVILEGNEMIDQKKEYIEMNPVKAGFVDEPHFWRLSSANPDSPIPVTEL